MKSLARLCICDGLHEPLLLDNVILRVGKSNVLAYIYSSNIQKLWAIIGRNFNCASICYDYNRHLR